ncbi:phospholipase D-like domain-containing protein [Glaesserella parasuis]|uniref:phospholipase D-like domain-containing protein n=1 Tax=Glaesserella parasuis TaxID=738 RepID=UPI0024368C97|nr:phospholipase D-like domain-containing protein [Glaesserella parasuis]MDG6827876.1 phospholipase D-like domain-containing protein [Glaesserella parasuis]MDO9893920.1 phospholipase D-like domain-containing protein [Glaesserella parasuis]MDP0020150.1 phospholipase D-like domain-containing protein [Glaesserella parasuis]MDP0060668.1 phospholipase D-like domain-containing protein [Glaesserella parasuis]MDP0062905.1 phospholipase D-like domain-containing protein [Glaesserella parasuis]
MQTEALFSNIADRISTELSQAESSIYIAVAWLTNRDLFNILVDKAKSGVTVQLLLSNDEINQNSSLDFSRLKIGNSVAYLVGDGKSDLMHNKFCVIDRRVVMTGSYNWSYKAEKNNHENIVITTDDFELADQFIAQFKHIRDSYFAHQEALEFPVAKVIKRLEILKNYVILEDDEDIERESRKLSVYQFQQDIAQIIRALSQNAFSQAVELIDEFIKRNHQIVVYGEVDIAALKLEIRHLEHQLNAYDDEKTELEKTLMLFQHRHTKELGKYISRLLHLRKLKFVWDDEKFAEAEQDEREYHQQLEEENTKEIQTLSEEDQKALKRAYKKASILCHPDKVAEEMKEDATETFTKLKQAYEENNLALVQEILDDLEQGNFFKSRTASISEKEKLQLEIRRLREKIQALETEIYTIKESEEYQTISEIEDWDEYFDRIREQLKDEIERIETELDD